MVVIQLLFPPIPEDTRKSARLFGKGNIYIKLGDQLNELISTLCPMEMEIHGVRSSEANTLYAVMTILQAAEELTDRQMVEALRNRVDLKYALHIPMNYRNVDPLELCEFRSQLLENSRSQLTFQALLERFIKFGLFRPDEEQSLNVSRVLDDVCTSMRIENVVEAMYQALETLSAWNPEWLRQIAPPQWYERYSPREQIPYWPNSGGKWKGRVIEIAADIQYLLKEYDCAQLTHLNEIQRLRQVWGEQFVVITNDETQTQEILWNQSGCVSCDPDRQAI